MTNPGILALDVGTVRIGLAFGHADTKLASPLVTLANDDQFFDNLTKLITEHQVGQLVVGWPRGLDGQDTDQTRYVEKFVQDLKTHVDLPVAQQDEALTSKKAEAELQARAKAYTKEDVDRLSATYILEDFLQEGKTS